MAWFQCCEHKPLDRNFGGPLRANLGLLLHVQDGNGELFGWFNAASTGASAHFWVSKSGRAVQYVDSAFRAWAQKSGNDTYCSVETEGHPNEPLTAAQVASLARIYAEGAQTHGWPYRLAEHDGDRGFGFHSMDPSFGHPFCPGELRKNQRQAVLDAAQGTAEEDDMDPKLEAGLRDLVTGLLVDANSEPGRRIQGGLSGLIDARVKAMLEDEDATQELVLRIARAVADAQK